jgi:translocation and assembly module TamB
MRRRLILFLIPTFLLGLFSWGIYQFLWTPNGIRWVLEMIPRFSNVRCSAERVSGRLAGAMKVEGLEIAWPEGRIKIQKYESEMAPWMLWQGRLVFKQIRADHLSWEDLSQEKKPLNLNLPKISGFLTRLWLEVSSFDLEDIQYRSLNETPLVLTSIRGTLAWRYGFLAVHPLHFKDSHGSLKGRVGLSFLNPEIQSDLEWRPLKETAGLDRLIIQGRLLPGKNPEQMTGPVSLIGLTGSREKYLLKTELGVSGQQINFRKTNLQVKGRQGLIRGEGSLRFDKDDAVYQALFTLEELDFSPELKRSTRISGPVRLEGRGENLSGYFDLKNKAQTWEAFHLAGTLQGGFSGIEVQLKTSEWLQGLIEGRVQIQWKEGVTLEGALQGRQLRPEGIQRGWKGLVNLEARGRARWDDKGFQDGDLDLRFPESQFQGKTLQGGIKARLDQEGLRVEEAGLQGRGFRFSGKGILAEGLKIEGKVDDLSALWPEGRGSCQAQGRVRWRKDRFGGDIQLEGKDLAWGDVRIGGLKMDASLDQENKDTAIQGRVRLQTPAFRTYLGDSLFVEVKGTLAQQEIAFSGKSAQARVQAVLEGSYKNKLWQGKILQLLGETAQGKNFKLQSPAALQISPDRIQLSPSIFLGEGEERLQMATDLDLKNMTGFTSLNWQQIDLSRFGSYQGEVLFGRSTGQAEVKWLGPDRLQMQARADLHGTLPIKDRPLNLSRAGFTVSWDDAGLRASWNVETADQARLWGQAASAEKGHPALPRQITFNGQWEGLDLNYFSAMSHPAVRVEGRCSGQAAGEWWSEGVFKLKGNSKINSGSLGWKDPETHLNARVKMAEAGIDWQGNRLQGNLNLELEGYGKITGDFNLPLMNRFPVTMDGKGPIEASIKGDLRERGLMAALLPEAVLSGQGRIQGQVSARGTWDNPNLQGGFDLTEPEVEIRPLGIRIRNIAARGIFDQDRINITSLKMVSGPGAINGTALFRLKKWRIESLEGKLTGDRFQFVNRPGLEAQGSPRIDFSGSPDRLVVGGILEIPEALLSGGQPEKVKRASPDVVIVDRPVEPKQKETVLPIQGQIRLVLGKEVRLKADGLEGNLEGTVDMRLKDSRDIKAFGEIKMVQGTYLLQGQKLTITRGRVIFNGPAENPGLDVLAIRRIRGVQSMEKWVDEVRAGFMVTGTLNKPLIRLYSQPPLSDTDIMSYILFGQATSQGGGQQNMAVLGQAAKTLMGKVMKGGNVPGILNPDVLEVRSESSSDPAQSMLTVGKYLDPRLFLGVGGSLFSSSYAVILRYSLSRNLEIETKGGTSSGGGIYFRMNFE